MKYFRSFFKVYFFCFFWFCLENDIFAKFSDSFWDSHKQNVCQVLSLTKQISKDSLTAEILSRKVFPFNGKDRLFLPVLVNENLILYIFKYFDGICMLGWQSPNQTENLNFPKESSFLPEDTFILTAKQFDLLLLQNETLFNNLTQDVFFLREWIPGLDERRYGYELNQLQAYLFIVRRPESSYTLASVIGEDKFFADITETDKELFFMHLPVLHFTSSLNRQEIFYCEVDDILVLKKLPSCLNRFYADPAKKKMFQRAINIKRESVLMSEFQDELFFEKLWTVLGVIADKYEHSNIPKRHLPALVGNIQRFLLSNGVTSLEMLKKAPDFLKQEIADRFFMAKTTAFFRDWREMKHLRKWYAFQENRLLKEKHPFRIKVFGCSTGQEVLSYAFDLLDRGISDFRILGTDIDPKVLQEAKEMTYTAEKFDSLGLKVKENVLKSYFELVNPGKFQIKFHNFFNQRIFYCKQDIVEPLDVKSLPKDFCPPFNLVSVKNVLLYLDKQSVENSIKNLEEILYPYGILFIRDKRYRGAYFLSSHLDSFIGVSDFILIKEPPNMSEEQFLEIFDMFENNRFPETYKYFYRYCSKRKFNLSKRILDLCRKDHPENIYSLEVLYEKALEDGDLNDAIVLLKKICKISPLYFVPLYFKFKNNNPNHEYSKREDFEKLLRFYQVVSSNDYSKMSPIILEKEINALREQELSEEAVLVIARSLEARDLSMFMNVNSSDNGMWIREAIIFLKARLQKTFSVSIVDHKIQMLHNFLNFFAEILPLQKKRNLLEDAINNLKKVSWEDLSLLGRLSAQKLICLFGKMAESREEKLDIFKWALSLDPFSEQELALLNDAWYSDYFSSKGIIYSELGFLNDDTNRLEEKQKMLQKALSFLEKSLEVRTVYGYMDILLIKKINRELEEISRKEKHE